METRSRKQIAFLDGGAAGPRKTTVEVEFLFDCSGSMSRGDLLDVVAFKKALLDPFDSVYLSIIGFSGHEVRVFTDATREVKLLQQGMRKLKAFGGGSTFLYESINRIFEDTHPPKEPTTRTMVVFSDGISNEMGRTKVVETARMNGFTLIPVVEDYDIEGITAFVPHGTSAKRADVARRVRSAFAALGEDTGGFAFQRHSGSKNPLSELLATLNKAIRYEYVAGVYLPPDRSGELHEFKVRMKDPTKGEVLGGKRAVRY